MPLLREANGCTDSGRLLKRGDMGAPDFKALFLKQYLIVLKFLINPAKYNAVNLEDIISGVARL